MTIINTSERRAPQILLLTAGLILGGRFSAVADDVHITPFEDRTTAFAGEELKVSMRVISDKTPEGTLRWLHSANQRTLARGELEVQRSSDVSASADFVLQTPELRDGVIFTTSMTVEFVPNGSDRAVASLDRTLTLFSRSPLADRTEWAKGLDIELFDPAGNTASTFDELPLPYKSVRNVAALNDPNQKGVLILGEGASLVRNRSLTESALHAAAAGRRVIMLAPIDGSISVPGTDGDRLPKGVIPGEMRFARHQIITQLDKRLDAHAWQGTENTIPASRFAIESRRGRVEATISEDSAAWPWLEVRFPESRGVLIVCGFQVIRHWNNGPTPRYLLLRILESVSEPKL